MKRIVAVILTISFGFSSEKFKLCWDLAKVLDTCYEAKIYMDCDKFSSMIWLEAFKFFKDADFADAMRVGCFTACISPKSAYKQFKAGFLKECLEKTLNK